MIDQMKYVVGYCFWREGCASMMRNICMALRKAGEHVNRGNIVKFMQSLALGAWELEKKEWRDGYCGKCLEKAFNQDPVGFKPVAEYFLTYVNELSSPAKYMLIDSFIGIFEGAYSGGVVEEIDLQ